MQPLCYAGIGSRQTPLDTLADMEEIAGQLSEDGWWLRTGAAPGADQAFGVGAGNDGLLLYLPWPSFCEKWVEVWGQYILRRPTEAAVKLAAKHHPAWDRCSPATKKLHGRNSHIILGKNLNKPVHAVVCWHNEEGGTMQGIRIAKAHGIPVFNLRDVSREEVLENMERIEEEVRNPLPDRQLELPLEV